MKTLIIYTTKYGCVSKAAVMLREQIQGEVALVNLMKDKAPDLSDYDTVILGGSIYVGKIQNELSEYIGMNLQMLLQKRVGLFICAAQEGDMLRQEFEDAYPAELFKHAVVKEHFGYELDFSKMSFLDKTITRMIPKIKESRFALRPEAIARFASGIVLQPLFNLSAKSRE